MADCPVEPPRPPRKGPATGRRLLREQERRGGLWRSLPQPSRWGEAAALVSWAAGGVSRSTAATWSPNQPASSKSPWGLTTSGSTTLAKFWNCFLTGGYGSAEESARKLFRNFGEPGKLLAQSCFACYPVGVRFCENPVDETAKCRIRLTASRRRACLIR